MFKRDFEAIGTHWEIEIETKLNQVASAKLYREITGLIEDFDQAYSRFRPDSLVSTMAKEAGQYPLRADFYHCLNFIRNFISLVLACLLH